MRAAWMKVRDLEYVENQMIPRLEKFVPDALRFSFELERNAVAIAAAEAAKEEMMAKGVFTYALTHTCIHKYILSYINSLVATVHTYFHPLYQSYIHTYTHTYICAREIDYRYFSVMMLKHYCIG